jgi:hypothetical protein
MKDSAHYETVGKYVELLNGLPEGETLYIPKGILEMVLGYARHSKFVVTRCNDGRFKVTISLR